MKNLSKQNGSTHIIVIVILVIALLGVLGFVFWQNFTKKDPVTTTSEQKKTTSQPVETVKDPNEGYLVLQDWKIKFKLATESDKITYYALPTNDAGIKKGFDAQYYEFSTKEVEALGESCAEPGGEVSGTVIRLANLSRSKDKIATQGVILVNDGQPVGGYYYYLGGAQSTCSSNGTDLQIQDRAKVVDLLGNPIVY